MRKFYALLYGVLVTALLLIGQQAFAQYSPSNYFVSKSANTWNPLSGGTVISELTMTANNVNTYDYGFYGWFSNEITLPFNFQFVNTLSNKIKVQSNGSVLIGGSANVPDNTMYDYEGWYGYYGYYEYYNYGSYQYGEQNIISAWYGSSFPLVGFTSIQYQVQGTAPNRSFVVETDNIGNYPAAIKANENYTGYDAYNPCAISYQVTLYEGSAFISKFDCSWGNYISGFNGGSNQYNYYWEEFEYGYVWTGMHRGAGDGITVYLGDFNSHNVGDQLTNVSTGLYDNGTYFVTTGPVGTATFAIRYPYNACFTHANPTPSDQQIVLINTALTPKVFLSNEGANSFASISVSCTITQSGIVAPVYTATVALNASQLPPPNGGTGSVIAFPAFTPLAYGTYSVTYAIATTVPTDNYTPDNTFTDAFIVSPPNNVASVAALLPTPGARTPVGYSTPISFRYRNLGVNTQYNTPVSVYITNSGGAVVYRDTETIPVWTSTPGFAIRDTTFDNLWIPNANGNYMICGVTLLSTDQNHADDTLCSPVSVRYLSDVAAITVLNPDDQEEKPEKKEFMPQGTFESVGVQDLFDVPARCQIYRCSDNTQVFSVDSIIPELNVDAGAVKFSFPSAQGTANNDIAKLAPGCYKICMFSRQSDDGDHSNDTACQVFSIIPRLQGVIQVGVGRRFQTISAAVDSMRFRGVGGNLTLQLTDNSYTENGTTDAGSPTAAIDFLGIAGPGPTAIVKWVPLPNVFPTITFSGNKQYCFNYDETSPQYMAWDGNNQQQPTADAISAEPAKRAITIISNSTVAGSVFRLAHGRTFETFKNLNIINNGNLTNTISRAFDMQNLYDQNSYYLFNLKDTSALHDITIDNCFIGNANVGISDSGTFPMFDNGAGVYKSLRNFNNVFSRNTIGSQQYPIGSTGIFLTNEDGLQIKRNEISWITGTSTTGNYNAAISATNGNHVNLIINGNKIHNIKAPNVAAGGNIIAGIDLQQNSLIYVTGSGTNPRTSALPQVTGNRIVNNFMYDMRVGASAATVIPIRDMVINSTTYTIQNDSVFNNSIAVANAPSLIVMSHVATPFLYNNILQNLNSNSSSTAVLYNLTLPRPMFKSVNSNNNLIDFRNASHFANMSEYDYATGVSTYALTVPDLNAWRTMSQQDILSLTGDPLFIADSLHEPIATTYIFTPASNNGAWFGSATQATDIDGDARIVGGSAPDIGADEFDGFQYINDLGVITITKPSGITDNTGITQVTAETPLAIQAMVKNYGSVINPNRVVSAKVEVSADNGLTWSFVQTVNSPAQNWAVNEAKVVDFTGPQITNEVGKLYRVTVSVANDQYNANNSIVKIFKITVKHKGALLSYNSNTLKGRMNKDSLAGALQRLGVPYDSLDRNAYGPNLIDYSPWWTVVWAEGDPSSAYYASSGVNLGNGSISLKEEQEIINYLGAGQTYAKKSIVVAGQNIAQYLDTAASNPFKQLNNVVTDGEFMLGWLHTRYVNQYPGLTYPVATPNTYKGLLQGTGLYFIFADSITAASPDVVKPTPVTGTVGANTSRFAYFYTTHPSTPTDSGAATAWNGSSFNVVFYAFDWADALQTNGLRDGQTSPENVSGTTRFLRGALDFIKSFGGIVLPVEFTNINGKQEADGNLITWSVSGQKDIDHYDVELLGSDNMWNVAGTVQAANSNDYSFNHTAQSVLANGSYTYRVEGVGLDGSRFSSNTVNVERTSASAAFAVDQNYPNPFANSTAIGFSLPADGTVSLRILDLTGKVIDAALENVEMGAGPHTYTFSGNSLASGTYIYEVSYTDASGATSVLHSKMSLTK